MTMKKRKKNNRLSFLTAIVCLLLFAGVLFLGMKNYEPEKSENPVQGVNSESSLKGYLGKGYAYAGSQEDASTGEESSFEEQAQILEDEPEEEPEKKKEEAQATVTPEPTSEPEASQTPEPDSQKEDTQKGISIRKTAPQERIMTAPKTIPSIMTKMVTRMMTAGKKHRTRTITGTRMGRRYRSVQRRRHLRSRNRHRNRRKTIIQRSPQT